MVDIVWSILYYYIFKGFHWMILARQVKTCLLNNTNLYILNPLKNTNTKWRVFKQRNHPIREFIDRCTSKETKSPVPINFY